MMSPGGGAKAHPRRRLLMPESERGKRGLPAEAVLEGLRTLSGWTVDEGKLLKSYSFADFVAGVRFVDRLTVTAEEQNHHPDLCVTWGKVSVTLWSHDVGGITARDFRLAMALDALYESGNAGAQ
jgi:4a-hydroxytetrahydrobiopterin dehydratase